MVLMNRLNKTESVVFLYFRFSLLLKDLFLRLLGGRNSCRCAAQNWLNFYPYINIVFIFFHILVLQEYWVLVESRISLGSVLGT